MSHQFDHAMCAVKTDRAGAVVYGSVGFTSHHGGRHTVGTQNSVIPLALGYLELLSIYDDASARQSSRHRLICEYLDREGGGLIGFALRTDTMDADIERVAASGLSFEGPVDAHRTRPDGVVLAWRVLRLTPQPTPALFPMLVAGDQSAPAFDGNANGITRCAGISLISDSPGDVTKTYQTLLGIEPTATRGRSDIAAEAVVFDIGGFSIEVLTPNGSGAARRWLERYGDSPFELAFTAPDLAAVQARTGIPEKDGTVIIPPEMTLGVRMAVRTG